MVSLRQAGLSNQIYTSYFQSSLLCLLDVEVHFENKEQAESETAQQKNRQRGGGIITS